MEQYVVEGGNPLVGEVEIGGAKNAALAILAASVMTDETVLIENMPDVRDTNILLQAMQSIGVIVDRVDPHTVKVNASHIHDLVIEDDFIKKIRASYYLLGALLGKYNKAEVALPGGCNIGSRPIDQHIKGAGTEVIRIRGVQKLHKTEYAIIPDQIEAGTFMFAAAATQGDVTVKNVIPKHLESISAKLMEIGCEVEESDDAVRVVASRPLTHTHVKTLPYPGFPTDMQPQITVALGLSQGTSIVTESIFENRFKYVDELTRMGASIKVEGNTAIIDGVARYTGASITAPDLRAGAALVIAALAAEGVSTVDDIRYIERGYENFPEKLRGLGAQIEKVDNERDIKKFRFKVV